VLCGDDPAQHLVEVQPEELPAAGGDEERQHGGDLLAVDGRVEALHPERRVRPVLSEDVRAEETQAWGALLRLRQDGVPGRDWRQMVRAITAFQHHEIMGES
jgi:hypothetical protein